MDTRPLSVEDLAGRVVAQLERGAFAELGPVDVGGGQYLEPVLAVKIILSDVESGVDYPGQDEGWTQARREALTREMLVFLGLVNSLGPAPHAEPMGQAAES